MPSRARAHQPLRLLILSDEALTTSGGSQRFLRNLLRRLPAKDYRATLVELRPEPDEQDRLHVVHPEALDSRIVLPIRAVYAAEGLRALHRLRRMVKEQGFDIIQSQHESADVFNALLPRGPRHAARISNRRDTGFLKSARLRAAARVLNHRYDRIVAPSQAILDAVAQTEGARRNRMLCIPNGVDTERFAPANAGRRRELRQMLALPEDAILVGCVASLTPVKRHTDLLDAFARVLQAVSNAHLLLVGEGPLKEAVVAQAAVPALAGHVHLLGQRPDVQHVLQALDLFVLASETEGLSNAILEAQSCGLPVVATRVGGNPELVDAECGALVPPGNPAQLGDTLLRLLRDSGQRTQMGMRARARVLQNHSLDSMVRAYESLYRELVHAG